MGRKVSFSRCKKKKFYTRAIFIGRIEPNSSAFEIVSMDSAELANTRNHIVEQQFVITGLIVVDFKFF